MTDNDALWRDFFNDESPEQKQVPEYESLNSKEGRKENRFKRLLLIRCMRDDRAMLAVTDYINECLGTQYTDTYTPNFDEIVANECSN